MFEEYQLLFAIISLFAFPVTFFALVLSVYFCDSYRAKIGNLINPKKNYGIIDIAERGNRISSHVVSFGETIANIGQRTFIIPSRVRVRYALPHAYFPYNDAIRNIHEVSKLDRIKDVLAGRKPKEEPKLDEETNLDDFNLPAPDLRVQEPTVLNGAIMAVKSMSEAEATSQMKQIHLFVIIILCASILTMIVAYLGLDKGNQIHAAVSGIAEAIKNIPVTIR